MKCVKIFISWIKVLLKHNTVQTRKRYSICSNCEYLSYIKMPVMDFKKGKLTKKKLLVCSSCLCPIISKIQLKSNKCPKKKW